jgi:CBS domain containing-hemolysin-like protein
VPKALALHRAERLALLVAPPIDLFARAVAPVVWVLQRTAQLVLRPLGIPSVGVGERPLTREELRGVLAEAGEHGAVAPDEEHMLSGVIDLRLRQARDVMRRWEDVDVVRLDAPPLEALDAMLTAAHTRFPAVRGSDEVVGVVHARDAWLAARAAGDQPPDAGALVRDAIIVPPTVRVDELLRTLRRERQQLAIVVDEYGRPAGIVSLEDILEGIVGEIEDEFDELDARFERRATRRRTPARHASTSSARASADAGGTTLEGSPPRAKRAACRRVERLDAPEQRLVRIGVGVESESRRQVATDVDPADAVAVLVEARGEERSAEVAGTATRMPPLTPLLAGMPTS